MPNCCSARAEIVCSDNLNAEKLYQTLEPVVSDANHNRCGAYVGSDRYWFYPTVDLENNTVILSGEIRWGFDDDEIVYLIRYLKATVDIQTVEVRYEECGCLLYGSYFYDGTMLTDTFVAAEDFSDYVEDIYYEELERLLKTKPSTGQL